MTIEPGQTLLVVTDGVYEAINDAGATWTMKGVAESLQNRLHLPANAMAELIRERLETFTGGLADDDRTVLVIKRLQ
jgi:serine phosphatase RsbU (regulator of sigma subunit)